MTLSETLRAARAAAGLSLAELAARVGVHRQALHHYEAGTRDPGGERLGQLAKALGVTFAVGPAGWSVNRPQKL